MLDHRLVQLAEGLHAGIGVSTPGRAVLEYLHRNGPTSVPEVARARYVSRQHIQTIVDALAEQDLVVGTPNPAHRRSPLFELTDVGRSAMASMHDRERLLLEQQITDIHADDVAAAASLLAAVRTALDQEEGR